MMLRVIILIVLITALLPLQLKSLDYVKFQKLTDWEKYVYFDTALQEAKKYKTAFLTEKQITKELFIEVEKLQKSFKPRWGFNFTVSGNLDNNFNGTLMISNNYQVYFFKRLYINPGFNINFGKNIINNTALFGGGISFGIGLILE